MPRYFKHAKAISLDGARVFGALSHNESVLWDADDVPILVDPKTIRMDTGFTDAAGTRVFDGDLIRNEKSSETYEIKFSRKYHVFYAEEQPAQMTIKANDFGKIIGERKSTVRVLCRDFLKECVVVEDERA